MIDKIKKVLINNSIDILKIILFCISYYFCIIGYFSVSIICLMLCFIKSNKNSSISILSSFLSYFILPSLLTSIISYNALSLVICILYLIISFVLVNKRKDYPLEYISIVYSIIYFIFNSLSLVNIVMPLLLFLFSLLLVFNIRINIYKLINKYTYNIIVIPSLLLSGIYIVTKLNYNNLNDTINLFSSHILNNISFVIFIYIFVLAIYLLLIGISKKNSSGILIIYSLVGILLLVNDIKFHIMGIPLELSDVSYLVPDNMSIMGDSIMSIGNWIYLSIFKFIAFILVMFILFRLGKKYNIVLNEIKNRVVVFISSILIISIGVIVISNKSFMINYIYRVSDVDFSSYSSVSSIYDDYGFIEGLLLSNSIKGSIKVDGYDKSSADSLMVSSEDDISWGKANVIFILSEAFTYIDNIDEIVFDKDVTPNINRYMNMSNAIVFDLLVPSYGGASANTEFEILTGASLKFFSPGMIAYTEYYNDSNGLYTPSVIREFNNNGYETVYLTPWDASLYNSSYVYSMWGTDKLIYKDSLTGSIKGYYYSDEDFVNDIYNELLDTEDGTYKFIMSASAENHYQYKNKYNSFDLNIVSSIYSDEENNLLLNYAQGVYDADKTLNMLYEKILELDTPTIIVFFGDHYPYLINKDGDNPYFKSSYFDSGIRDLKEYTTKGVILANYDIDISDSISYINANYLGSYILNKLDLEVSDYFKYVDFLRKKIPVFTRDGVYKNGVISTEEDKMFLNSYKLVQYRNFYDYE